MTSRWLLVAFVGFTSACSSSGPMAENDQASERGDESECPLPRSLALDTLKLQRAEAVMYTFDSGERLNYMGFTAMSADTDLWWDLALFNGRKPFEAGLATGVFPVAEGIGMMVVVRRKITTAGSHGVLKRTFIVDTAVAPGTLEVKAIGETFSASLRGVRLREVGRQGEYLDCTVELEDFEFSSAVRRQQ